MTWNPALREDVRGQLAEVMFDDDSCSDEDCGNCQATLDALTDRVLTLLEP